MELEDFTLSEIDDIFNSSLHYVLLLFFIFVAAWMPYRFLSRVHNQKNRDVPTSTSSLTLIYLTAVKTIYKQSTATFPPMCLALQALKGVCRAMDRIRIFRFHIGFKPIVIFFKPETVEVVLSSTTLISKSFQYRFLSSWLATGLLTSTGEKWRTRRKLLSPSFHFAILSDFVPIFYEQSNILVTRLRSLVEQPWVDIVPLITSCTLDIICETAMGVSINAQTGGCKDYVQAIFDVGDIFYYRVLRPWLYSDVIFNCCPSGRRFNANIRLISNFTKKVIKEKKEDLIKNKKIGPDVKSAANGSPSQKKKRLAFLELLLEHHLKNASFTEEGIREEVETFMFEGHDTTAMALSWSLYFLGLYPDMQKEVHDELDEIFRNDPDREITREDLSQMKYLECVIKETLRLRPSVPIVAREAHEDFDVLNYTVKRGSICAIFSLMLHQDPDEFPDPEKFNPERFFPENSARRHPYAYVPFSAGPRNCIGQKFALMEEKTVLANVLRQFCVKSLDPRDKVNLALNLIMKNVQPLRLSFIPRR